MANILSMIRVVWASFLFSIPLLLATFIGTCLSSLIIWAIRKRQRSETKTGFALPLVFALWGVAIGFIGGASRSPIAEAVVTGLFGLFPPLLIYFGEKSQKLSGIKESTCLFCIFLFIGVVAGAKQRQQLDDFDRDYKRYEMKFDNWLKRDYDFWKVDMDLYYQRQLKQIEQKK